MCCATIYKNMEFVVVLDKNIQSTLITMSGMCCFQIWLVLLLHVSYFHHINRSVYPAVFDISDNNRKKLRCFSVQFVCHETKELRFHNCGRRPDTREFTDRRHPADTPSSTTSVRTNLDETTSILSPRLEAPCRTHALTALRTHAHDHSHQTAQIAITVPFSLWR